MKRFIVRENDQRIIVIFVFSKIFISVLEVFFPDDLTTIDILFYLIFPILESYLIFIYHNQYFSRITDFELLGFFETQTNRAKKL
jgi:hypothetical protein